MTIQRAPTCLAVLQEHLTAFDWHCERHEQGELLTGEPAGGGRRLHFRLHDRDSRPADVLIFDDAQPGALPDDVQFGTDDDLAPLATASRMPDPLLLRLGRDLVFARLFGADGTAPPLHVYVDSVQASCAQAAELSLPRPEAIVQQAHVVNGAARRRERQIADLIERAHDGEAALLAMHGTLGWESLFSHVLLPAHVHALTASGGTPVATRIPLFVSLAEARTIGLQRALWEAAWAATRIPMSETQVTALLAAGYFHIYAPDLERLREGPVLDPNSELIATILSAAQTGGSFTLGCDRDQVFHGPLFTGNAADDALDPFRTVGERFMWDSGLELYDSEVPDVARSEPLHKALTARLNGLRGEIVRRAEGRISPLEAERLLSALATEAGADPAGAFTDQEIRRQLLPRLTGDRVRPGNLRLAHAAIAGASALACVAPGVHRFRSTLFANWLVREALASALEALLFENDPERIDALFRRAAFPFWLVEWAIGQLGEEPTAMLRAALPGYLLRHQFRSGASASEGRLIGNLWTLISAVVQAADRQTPGSAESRMKEILVAGAKLNSVSLPQACFSNISLWGCEFHDCDLSHALFRGCDLSGVSFEESSLAGARFEQCTFSKSTSFLGADVSGALLLECDTALDLLTDPDAPEQLAGSNWTASTMIVARGDDRAAKAIEPFQDAALSAGAFRIGDHSVPWPAAAFQALVHGRWNERPVRVRTHAHPAGLLCRLQDFNSVAAGAFAMQGLDDGFQSWKAIEYAGAGVAGQWFVGVDNRGWAWHARSDPDRLTWSRIKGVDSAVEVSIFELRSAAGIWPANHLLVAIRREDSAEPLLAGTISVAGAVQLESAPVNDGVSAMRWFRPARAGSPLPELAIGCSRGGGRLLRYDMDRSGWERTGPMPGAFGLQIEAFGYSPRENLLLACAGNGDVLGLRHLEAGSLEQIFRFNTALRRIVDVAVLNREGQFIVVGISEQEMRVPDPAQRKLLWVLMGASGSVVTVVSYATDDLGADDVAIPIVDDDETSGTFDGGLERAEQLHATAALLAELRPERHTVPVTPRQRKLVELQLTEGSAAVDGENLRLPDSIDDAFGPRFRTVELTIVDAPFTDRNGNNFPSATRHYSEADLDLVSFEPGRVKISVSPSFVVGREAARAVLTIGYPSQEGSDDEDSRRGLSLTVQRPFDLAIEWEDNPFVIDGTPVSDRQFFGFGAQLDEVVKVLVEERSHLLLSSTRRAGKTSFIRRAAEMLRNGDPRRVAVTISGEDVNKDGRVERAVQDALRYIGQTEGRRDYTELGSLDLPAKGDIVETLAHLADAAAAFAKPFVIFVDEWGYLNKESAGTTFANSGDKLKAAGIALCLTSVPSDFPAAESQSQSFDYRFFRRADLRRLGRNELDELVRRPLGEREFSISDDARERDFIWWLSSGSPHDANILMHFAFKAAKVEFEATDGASGRIVRAKHFLREDGTLAAEPWAILREKYESQQGYLLDKLSEPEKAEMRGIARALEQLPPDFAPNRDSGLSIPPLGIPARGMTQDPKLQIFSDSGYRAPTTSNLDGNPADDLIAYQLWLPWALAEYIRRTGD